MGRLFGVRWDSVGGRKRRWETREDVLTTLLMVFNGIYTEKSDIKNYLTLNLIILKA